MESKKKMLFIFNPFSGKAQIKSKLFEIIDVFVKGGYEVIVHPTQAVGDGFEKTKELAPQVDLVVCISRDAMISFSSSGFFGRLIRVTSKSPSSRRTSCPGRFLKPPTDLAFVTIP